MYEMRDLFVQVRIQTMPGYANTLREAFPKMYADEGLGGFYKGLVPLWLRQIPYTMMKFACFERTLELLYKYVVPKPRQECTKGEQLVVTFAAGYIAGVFCAIVSHPADSVSIFSLMVTFLSLPSFINYYVFYVASGCIKIESRKRSISSRCSEEAWYGWSMEGSWSSNRYDWYVNGSAVVHL